MPALEPRPYQPPTGGVPWGLIIGTTAVLVLGIFVALTLGRTVRENPAPQVPQLPPGIAQARPAPPSFPLPIAPAPVAPPKPSVADVMQGFGLIGFWAPDCNQGPSQMNDYTQYLVRQQNEGTAVIDKGAAGRTEFTIRDAVRLAPNRLGFNIEHGFPRTNNYLEFLVETGRYLPWFERSDSGQIVVANGVFSQNGQQMRWRFHCGSSPPPKIPSARIGPIGRPAIIGVPTPIGR
jgi:hypothetical protein